MTAQHPLFDERQESPFAVPSLSTPLERFEAIQADPNLRNTGACLRAHEAVYPGCGAASILRDVPRRDDRLIGEVRAAVGEFRERMPGSEETRYLEWVLSELTAAAVDGGGV